jgi:hypothetical protein
MTAEIASGVRSVKDDPVNQGSEDFPAIAIKRRGGKEEAGQVLAESISARRKHPS